jgi:hypothetical protein
MARKRNKKNDDVVENTGNVAVLEPETFSIADSGTENAGNAEPVPVVDDPNLGQRHGIPNDHFGIVTDESGIPQFVGTEQPDPEQYPDTATPEPAPVADVPTQSTEPPPGTGMSFVLLTYDIPSVAKLDPPAWELRPHGFRLQGSVWVVTEFSVYALAEYIHELRTKHHALVDVFKMGADQGPRLVQKAIEVFNTELAEQTERTQKTITDADKRHLDDGDLSTGTTATFETRDKCEERFAINCQYGLKRLERLYTDIESAARKFGVDPASITINDARTMHDVMKSDIDAKIAAYAAVTRAMRAAGGDAAIMADASKTGDVPVGIVADAAQESNIDPKLVETLRRELGGM